jgi:hypothetical protein
MVKLKKFTTNDLFKIGIKLRGYNLVENRGEIEAI